MAYIANVDTTEGGLVGKSLHLAWPAVLQALLVNFYAFNDYLFVGMLGDAAATAALSACFAVLIINYCLLAIFPTGAMSLIARTFGARRIDRAAAIIRQGLSATLLWSLVVSVLGLVMLPQLIAAANVTPQVGVKIGEYLRVIYWTTPSFALMLVVVGAFRGCGNTRVPLILECFSLVINVALNYTLVIGWGPFESMGITGAAIATAVSRAVPGVIGLVLIWRGALGFSLVEEGTTWRQSWRPRFDALRAMARIGVFECLAGMMYGFVYLVLNRMAGELGPAAQGGLGAGLRGIEWIGFAFGDGFFAASVAIVGQNVGARQLERAYKGAWIAAGLSAVSCQLVGFAFILFPYELCSLVTDDPLTLEYAATYVRIIGWAMGAVGLEMSMFGAMIGVGHTEVAFAISGGSNLLRVPLAAALLFGPAATLHGSAWALFGSGVAPPITGAFSALAITIGVTAMLKALLFIVYMVVRRDRFAS
ncbi:MAG: MATE family efflux transporter [Bradymonadaceae bacterium]|nr:MATE family efflux transporter [Lujinxingiaceae bacterium]